MRKLTALLLTAITVSSVLVVNTDTATAFPVRQMMVIESPEAIEGLHTRITQIRDTGDSDGAVLLAFWLAGADTDELMQALCIRSHETPAGDHLIGDADHVRGYYYSYSDNGLGVINAWNHEDSGPMQINRPTWQARAEAIGYPWGLVLTDPWFNALMSVHIWISAGYKFTPWSTLKYCRNTQANYRYALAA